MSHEIGHALGFLHTHNRADRDEYVSVNLANVKVSKIIYSVRVIT